MHDDYSTLQRAAQKQTKREKEANRKLWHYFQGGERRARAGLPQDPDPKWSEAQKAAYRRGHKFGRNW